MTNEDKCPSFNEVWEELEHGEGGEIFVKARKIEKELTKSIEMEHDKLEAQARWVCCPMCDREKCNRNADDCDAKKWIEKKVKKGEEE